ncbi:PWWP domain-containing DNA repair factor 3B isoform X1 [Salmo trutta]|uniref:PWWP domain-containing DNA repair factor 3B-like n=1 Tax=Salmo trutta TaxID=8032 RepID=A0A673X3F2_SALTR|nr:PWWP domain-containing DNA repair factor 3B-like isoform X1 [Salmo trutta]XP_029562470.1 PWWP domain-containing DNA repair factor 3B-like isoform X1 [Salmo trutta]
MEASEYLLCKWKGHHWPAKVLRRVCNSKRKKDMEVEMLGEGHRVWVQQKETQALTQECIESISGHLSDHASKRRDPIRELKYRRALRLALDMFPSGETNSTLVLGDPRTPEKGRDQQLPPAPEEQEMRARRVVRANEPQSEENNDCASQKTSPGAAQENITVHSVADVSSDLSLTPPSSSPLQPLQVSFDEQEDSSLEDEEDDDLPSFISPKKTLSITKGACVWCKYQRCPFWPAMVMYVSRKEKKASVVFIDTFLFTQKRKGVKVSLKNIKPFDCEESNELVDKAKEKYGTAIHYCLKLIGDYRIRLGCGSFSGSLVEYVADDISIPMRKLYLLGPSDSYLASPSQDLEDQRSYQGTPEDHATTEGSDQEPQVSKRLLPDRAKAARDRANDKLLQFIVDKRGVERHLQAIISGQVVSKWLKAFRKASGQAVDPYFETDQQVEQVFTYLRSIMEEALPSLPELDQIRFILEVLLPEAVIHGISEVDDISLVKAEEKYSQGPGISNREREEFDLMIVRQMKKRQSRKDKE